MGGTDCQLSLKPQQANSPVARTPQLFKPPAETAIKTPAGATDSPPLFAPQHSRLPETRTAQLWDQPAETLEKVPAGATDSPSLFEPQHAKLPSARRPQMWLYPAERATNCPDGAVAASPVPQHRTVLSAPRMAQLENPPAATAEKVPLGASDRLSSTPQHVIVPVAARPQLW